MPLSRRWWRGEIRTVIFPYRVEGLRSSRLLLDVKVPRLFHYDRSLWMTVESLVAVHTGIRSKERRNLGFGRRNITLPLSFTRRHY